MSDNPATSEEDLKRAVAAARARPPRLVDPKTQQRFVLLSEEEYERLTGYDASPWTDEGRDLLRAEAVEALGWDGMEPYDMKVTAETLS